MEVVDIDEMVVLDGKPATRTCGVGEGDEIINVWKSANVGKNKNSLQCHALSRFYYIW